jgi:hypothetical protein
MPGSEGFKRLEVVDAQDETEILSQLQAAVAAEAGNTLG